MGAIRGLLKMECSHSPVGVTFCVIFTQKRLIASPSGLWTTPGPCWKGKSTSCSARSRILLQFSTWPSGGTEDTLKYTTTPSPTSRLPHLSKCPPSSWSHQQRQRTERSTSAWPCWSLDQRDHSHLQLWLLSRLTRLCTVSHEVFPFVK